MSSVAVNHLVRAVSADSVSTQRAQIEFSLGEQLSSTLLLRERVAPPTTSTGIPALDALTGGLPRGALSELSGPASSGRTGVMLTALAKATQREEVCALVDASDSFDPASAAAAGVDLDRLLWVRCSEQKSISKHTALTPLQKSGRSGKAGFAFSHALEQVLKVTDLLLQGGGFGMVVLDLGDIPMESVRRIPLTSWFRFRRAVEPTTTVLLLIEQEPCAKTCASLVLRLQSVSICTTASSRHSCSSHHEAKNVQVVSRLLRMHLSETVQAAIDPESRQSGVPENNVVSHSDPLQGMQFRAEVLRSWRQRKSPRSVGAQFELRAAI